MATNPNKKELPSTYFVQDRANEDERMRVSIQDQLLTVVMQGVLPEQPDPTSFAHVLDIGCGTGGWLIEAARTYPTMVQLVGVDVSQHMVEYAQAQAVAAHMDQRVEFRVMDVLQTLNFPDGSFDLVNQRLGVSYMRTWDWPRLVGEFLRVTRAGGVIRLTETNMNEENTSPALSRLGTLMLEASYKAGHLFTPHSTGVTSQLASLLDRYGLQQVQTCTHKMTYHSGTPAGQAFSQDMAHLFRTALPFFRRWTQVPADYEELYQQALIDMQQPDFMATWTLLTAWGTIPPGASSPL